MKDKKIWVRQWIKKMGIHSFTDKDPDPYNMNQIRKKKKNILTLSNQIYIYKKHIILSEKQNQI